MSSADRISLADQGDRHRRYIALAVLAMGLLSALSAAARVVGPDATAAVRWLELGLVAVMLRYLAPVFLAKLRKPAAEWPLKVGLDGFVAKAKNDAQVASWTATFALLAFGATFGDRLPELPLEVYLQTVLAVMLCVFAGTFLYLNRGLGEEGSEDTADA